MGIEYKKNLAVFTGDVIGDEAEGLLQWVSDNPRGKIDLAACTHLHTANLQVLMAAKPSIKALPEDESLSAWIDSAMQSK
jgi:hypothetical protein